MFILSVVSILSRPPNYFPFVLDIPPSLDSSPDKSNAPSKKQLLDWTPGGDHELDFFIQICTALHTSQSHILEKVLLKSHLKLPSSASSPNYIQKFWVKLRMDVCHGYYRFVLGQHILTIISSSVNMELQVSLIPKTENKTYHSSIWHGCPSVLSKSTELLQVGKKRQFSNQEKLN